MPFPPNLSTPIPLAAPRMLVALQGVTVLAVEDSRFASDALRLMCQRSGARLRRADSLLAARAHLSVYRPDLVLIDLGLPDGRGEELIRELSVTPFPPAVLGMSGDPDARQGAMAAGALGFLDKPFPGLAAFQHCLVAHLPDRAERLIGGAGGTVQADPLALSEDLAMAAAALRAGPGIAERAYLSGFLAGIARQTADAPLHDASASIDLAGAELGPVTRLVEARIAAVSAFMTPD